MVSIGYTELDIANSALIALRQDKLTLLDEESDVALMVKAKLPLVIDEVLNEAPWVCAVRTVPLAKVTPSSSVYSLEYKYRLPNTPVMLRPITIVLDNLPYYVNNRYYTDENNPEQSKYLIEGDYLYTDAEEVILQYIGRIPVANMSIDVIRCVEANLTYELSYNLVNSTSNADMHYKVYQSKLNKAKAKNAKINQPITFDGEASKGRYYDGSICE